MRNITEIPCPLCGKPMFELGVRAGVALLDCACGFVSIDLRSWKYPYSEKDYYAAEEMRIQRPTYPWIRHRVNRLRRHLTGGTVCDLGSGSGETVIALDEAGFQAIGVEESRVATEFLMSAYPSATWRNCGIFEYLVECPKHDGITMYHVLEHIPNPKNVCSLLKQAIRIGGLLVIEVPDVSSGQAKSENWGNYLQHHVNYFDLRTLRALLEPLGFELLECEPKYNMTQPSGVHWKDWITSTLSRLGRHSMISTCWRRV